MLKKFLHITFILISVITWVLILAIVPLPQGFIGDIKLWALLLCITFGLSLWARISLKSPAAQGDYDGLSLTLFIAMWPYFLSRLVLPPLFSMILIFPVLIWTVFCLGATSFLLHHDKKSAAYRHLARIQARFPKSMALAEQRVMLAEHDHDHEAIIAEMSRIISLHSFSLERISLHKMRLASYLALGNGEKALYDARLVVQTEPQNDLAFIQRGTAFLLINELDAAAADLARGLHLATAPHRKVIAEVNLGLVEYAIENDAAAEKYWSQALTIPLSPQEITLYRPQIYFVMGLLAFRQGHQSRAAQAFRSMIKINPQSIEGRAGMAVLHAANDRWDTALKIWRDLIEEQAYFAQPDEVIRRHFGWTPPMADGVRQIITRLKAPSVQEMDNHAAQVPSQALVSR